ncbi:MAG: hypothetical protein DRJ52_00845 [Thermoprotei archaeon]|nr:MAG: hypothetical protein DRJ52_00845 [Thermoprotei archaeon]RLF00439.1 MAG: hypothetical protein DRJ63_02560 [Thermoprotei archaeon]
MDKLKTIIEEIKELHLEFNEAVSSDDIDNAINIGFKLYSKLTEVSRTYILFNIIDNTVKETVSDIIRDYEQALFYLQGADDALRSFSSESLLKARREILRLLIAYVQGLIGFVLGALAILMDSGKVGSLESSEVKESARKKNVLLHII